MKGMTKEDQLLEACERVKERLAYASLENFVADVMEHCPSAIEKYRDSIIEAVEEHVYGHYFDRD